MDMPESAKNKKRLLKKIYQENSDVWSQGETKEFYV